MNTLDIIVVIVLVLSAGFAYMRGFVREVLSIVAWLGAAVIAFFGYPHIAPLIGFLPPGAIRNGAAGAAIFIVALIVLSIITGTVAHRVSQSGLSSIDRVFGLLFGLARGAVLVCLGYIALTWYFPDKSQPKWVSEARSLPMLEAGRNAIISVVPSGWNVPAKGTASGSSGTGGGGTVENAMRALMAPAPTAKPAPDVPSYNQHDRSDMNRLIDQQQGQKQ
jgi:membrane protein required for colicin V production